ncbi:MAG: hypothetical protein JRN20_14470 [Nitrososphaerota archaeon]|nr:hypothetical protein [Nitrososphaerota archaeon]
MSGKDMVANSKLASLSEEEVKRIRMLCDVSDAIGSYLTLKELLSLVPLEISESALSENWGAFVGLERYRISSGMIINKEHEDRDLGAIREEEWDKISRANRNLKHSMNFSNLCSHIGLKVLSVSGSTSYLSVTRDGDLDFFCIMNEEAIWPSLVKFLLLARAFRIVNRGSPPICLSYVVDEEFAIREFTKHQDGLFARDALYTRILRGRNYYSHLLKLSPWMEEYFPKMYRERTERIPVENVTINSGSHFQKIVNLFVYFTAGSYIKLKSYLLNRKYAKEKRWSSLFRVRVAEDHCIYESAKYLNLKKLYEPMDKGQKLRDTAKKKS